MELEILPLELRKLGLTEKEVRVYLAALELGYTSVQNIAQKTKISRPTAYGIIKSLKDKGLVSQSKGRGKYLTAESPDKLLGILKREKKEIEEKEREFIRIISILKDKYQLGDKREIKTYKTKFGLEILLNDFLTTQSREIFVLANNEKIWPSKARQTAYKKIKQRLGQIQIKELSKKSDIDFDGIVIIYDKVIILTDKSSGILIENKVIVNLIKSLFLYSC
ncbi:helix-turn-helix domain-containing protein [Patescibacteria group bacterium]|nr:helix-turn-helix domain-containing protein [Patescibacteria group bacterium]MBU1563783.1 helix-turn-helix domain-containing protein [Patescibacteria group bacterium]MBU2068098.1 helix-turn-helix domain-containing protein [Patescibacteria group bacterium]